MCQGSVRMDGCVRWWLQTTCWYLSVCVLWPAVTLFHHVMECVCVTPAVQRGSWEQVDGRLRCAPAVAHCTGLDLIWDTDSMSQLVGSCKWCETSHTLLLLLWNWKTASCYYAIVFQSFSTTGKYADYHLWYWANLLIFGACLQMLRHI